MTYPHVMSEVDTILAALAGRSLARFGDGELKIATGRHAKSQRHDGVLQSYLVQALREPEGPCLPCIPTCAAESPKAAFWRPYRSSQYARLYHPQARYGSSLVTRPDSAPWIDAPEYWALVSQLWQGQDIVLVTGSRKGLQPKDLDGAASVQLLEAPNHGAWTVAQDLFAALRHEQRRVILCLGATATALAWQLARKGVHALDLGHIALFLRKHRAGQPAVALTPTEKAMP